MPFSLNGFGTALCGYSAPIRWMESRFLSLSAAPVPDHDALECVVALFLPVVPLRAVHTFAWDGGQYRAVRIRATPHLVLRAFGRPWSFALATVGGLVLTWNGLVALLDGNVGVRAWAAGGGIAFLAGVVFTGLLNRMDRKHRDIRLIIGSHPFGSSDPATWTDEMIAKVENPQDIAQGRAALDGGRFSDAMLAARLAVARQDPEGERLTKDILRDFRVRTVLPFLRRTPWKWPQLLEAAASAFPGGGIGAGAPIG